LYLLTVHLQPRKSVKEDKTYTCCSQSSIHIIFYTNENVLAQLVNEVYSDKVEPLCNSFKYGVYNSLQTPSNGKRHV